MEKIDTELMLKRNSDNMKILSFIRNFLQDNALSGMKFSQALEILNVVPNQDSFDEEPEETIKRINDSLKVLMENEYERS